MTKQEIISEILESGSRYIVTSISIESCHVSIAIRDILDTDYLPNDFKWHERSFGLDEEDY